MNAHLCNDHRQSEYGGVVFGGWARMAQTISSFSIVEVAKPNIGENWPARVRADITINLNVRDQIKNEWEGMNLWDVPFKKTHDFCLDSRTGVGKSGEPQLCTV